MIAAIVSEWRKYSTTKLWWIFAIVVFLGSVAYAALVGLVYVYGSGTEDPSLAAAPEVMLGIYNGGNTFARIFALVLGVMAMGQEYRHKTLSWAYLATPRRLVVVGSKALVTLGFGLCYGLLNFLGGFVVAAFLAWRFDGQLFLNDPEVWRGILLGIVSIGLWCLMGLGLGILIRNLTVAVIVAIAFSYIVEPVATLVLFFVEQNLLLNLMPSTATSVLIGLATTPVAMMPPEPFAWWGGGLVLLAWAAIPAIIGTKLTLNRDLE